ncbi:MAG TPA: hypothetical protein VLH56_07820 [Dissulfurispiraceae bacterium]|nr:hypothetical protein [Dissulfurispiraceae bacterium]
MMNMRDIFAHDGFGVFSTSGRDGSVNAAVYARPHVVDAATVAWGMTDGRTLTNIRDNPHASYIFRLGSHGYSGARLSLKLLHIEDEGQMLATVREKTASIVSPAAAQAVRHVAYFAVIEIRSLV